MQDFVIDPRYVLEDGLELRLAIRLSDRTLCVVGTNLKRGTQDPTSFLPHLNDKEYQRLVCQDPQDLGPVQRSEPREYVQVGEEEI